MLENAIAAPAISTETLTGPPPTIARAVLTDLLATRPGRFVAGGLAVLVVAVAGALVVLWPGPDAGIDTPGTTATERAVVERVNRVACSASQTQRCQLLQLRIESGPDAGDRVRLTLPGTDFAPRVERGDTLRVAPNEAPEGDPAAPPGDGAVAPEAYAFADFERRSPLWILAAVFAVLVVALGRWKGVRSLVGLVLSLAVVTQFMVPAILDGAAPLPVALVGALAVMLVTVVLAHGTGVTSVAAVLGASVSLLATALLAVLFVELAQITGFSSEEASLLRGSEAGGQGGLSLRGLVLAGIVVGALGVLDDVTVSQASTVLALWRANPSLPIRRLFTEGLTVGRDHLSATVNTLVLAYVGAALPVLLIFETQGTSFGDALNAEGVAGEVVAMLVGSIGLVLAVPLTTALAAWLAKLAPAAAAAAAASAHAGHRH
jgi:uncharacterized membrane protein